MTETFHRVLMFVGGVLVGAAGLLGGTDLVKPEVMAWTAFAGGLAVVVANQIRVQWPATKGEANTQTETTTTTTTTPPVTP